MDENSHRQKVMETLQKHFGYDSLREGQEEIIAALLQGRDVVGIMPTGAGKSLCFQVPALLLTGITLVVSPLISLMKDQVNALTQSGVPAAFLNSTLTAAQNRRALELAKQGAYRIVYVAPERLGSPDFMDFALHAELALVAVDEAHCVSQWGQDFRPSYLRIGDFLGQLPHRPAVGAFTATATGQVREDIVSLLGLRSPLLLTTGFDRQNLYYEVQSPKNKFTALQQFLHTRGDLSGIVYCLTRKTVEQVHERLVDLGYDAGRYHAGLTPEERKENQEKFQSDQYRVMVATNAFGMGIDKSNVSYVVHYNMPKNLEAYYQEAGRAGRDGSPAECILFYSGKDVVTNQFFIDNAQENEAMDPETFRLFVQREKERLRHMTFYCHTNDCLRKYILRYFGESAPGYCGNCHRCRNHGERVDITVEAQKILSCIRRMGERFGMAMTVNVLRGISNEQVQRLGFDKLSTFGILSELGEGRLRDMIGHLQVTGHIVSTEGSYPVLRWGENARKVLFEGERLEMNILREEPPAAKKAAAAGVENPRLYAKLQALRAKLAKEQSVPTYVVFTDAALRDMCRLLPRTEQELLRVNGVGQVKLQKYGQAFLDVLREEGAEHSEPPSPSPKPAPPKGEAPPPQELLARMMRSNLISKGFGEGPSPWTEEEDRLLRERWAERDSPENIARQLGRPSGAVSTRLKQLGLDQPPPEGTT